MDHSFQNFVNSGVVELIMMQVHRTNGMLGEKCFGVPALVQWVKSPTAVAQATVEVWV